MARARPTAPEEPEEPSECCICFEPLSPPDRDVFSTEATSPFDLSDSALRCVGGHDVCCGCVCKLVRPHRLPRGDRRVTGEDTGLAYACPICRRVCILNSMHALVLLKRSWAKAADSFDGPASRRVERMQHWNRGQASHLQ